jgi:hypothetical protein
MGLFQFNILLVFIAKVRMMGFAIVSKEFRFVFTFAQLFSCYSLVFQGLFDYQIMIGF